MDRPATAVGRPPASPWARWWLPMLSTAAALGYALAVAATNRQGDLQTYLLGGRYVLSGELYRVVYAPTHLGFTYPPFPALLAYPLARLPNLLVRLSWAFANVAALVALLAVSLRACRPQMTRAAVVWWSLALCTPAAFLEPVRVTMALGQVDLFIVAACVADLALPRQLWVPGTGRRLPRGVLTGLAAAVKLTPLALVVMLFLARQWGTARRATATFLAVSLATAAAVPGQSWSYWTHYAFDAKRVGSMVWAGNQSLRGVVLRLTHHYVSFGPTTALSLAVGLVGLPLAAMCWQRLSPFHGVVVGFATIGLISPVSWDHHFVWFVPLAVLIALDARRLWVRTVLPAALAIVGWAAPIWWVPHGGRREYHESGAQLLLSNTYAIVAAGVLVGAAVLLVARRPAHHRQSSEESVAGALRSGRRPASPAGVVLPAMTGPPPAGTEESA